MNIQVALLAHRQAWWGMLATCGLHAWCQVVCNRYRYWPHEWYFPPDLVRKTMGKPFDVPSWSHQTVSDWIPFCWRSFWYLIFVTLAVIWRLPPSKLHIETVYAQFLCAMRVCTHAQAGVPGVLSTMVAPVALPAHRGRFHPAPLPQSTTFGSPTS